MPRISKRVKVINDVEAFLHFTLLYECVAHLGLIDTPKVNIAGVDTSVGLFALIVSYIQHGVVSRLRYLPGIRQASVPKSSYWMRAVLPLYDAARRASFIRFNDQVFNHVIRLISRHCKRYFRGRRGPEQHSVRLQVAIGLTRIGSCGNAASVARVAAFFGTSECFVSKATSRTILSLNSLARRFIKWPTTEERKFLSDFAGRGYGFSGAIGSVDGTTIPLFKSPAVVPWSFFDRKSRYSLHALVTVNHHYEVIDIVVNYLGPAPDSVVQRDAVWQRYPNEFFREREYLLGDKGMLQTLEVLIPYKGALAALADNANFNTQLARLRIIAEQVIGKVKARFSSLKELRIQVETMEDVKRGGEWIIAAFVLHNICVKGRDYIPPESIYSFRSNEPVPDSTQSCQGSRLETFRANIKETVIQSMKETGRYVE